MRRRGYALSMTDSELYDIAVVGAGPAGITAAIHAARQGARTVLLDRMPDPAQKLLLSGGGRCNILPIKEDFTVYTTDSSPFVVRNILRSWTLADVRLFLEADVGLRLKVDEDSGKVFVVGGGKEARQRLLEAARKRGVVLVRSFLVRRLGGEEPFFLTSPQKKTVRARRVILACGGRSYPHTGSDGAGIELARGRGHQIVPPYPALTSLIGACSEHRTLAGLTLTATVTARSTTEQSVCHDGFLFTHRGYSGPAVMNTSHVVSRARSRREPFQIHVSWSRLTDAAWRALLSEGKRTVRGVLTREMPDRLADLLLDEAGVSEARVATLPREGRDRLIRLLTNYPLPITRNDGFDVAEVTGGGVHLGELDHRTLQSRKVTGLFVCGEMLDAFGPIGGTNLLWAFVTGRIAGEGAARSG